MFFKAHIHKLSCITQIQTLISLSHSSTDIIYCDIEEDLYLTKETASSLKEKHLNQNKDKRRQNQGKGKFSWKLN